MRCEECGGKREYSLLTHDMRRSAAKRLTRCGMGQSLVMRFGGWGTSAMFDRYNIIDETEEAEAMARFVKREKRHKPPFSPRKSESGNSVQAEKRETIQ